MPTHASTKVHWSEIQLAWHMLSQNNDLPAPSSVCIDASAVTLAVDTADAVEAWADHMETDVEAEYHDDGTMTLRADGTVTVYGLSAGRRMLVDETVRVVVYRPTVTHQGRLV